MSQDALQRAFLVDRGLLPAAVLDRALAHRKDPSRDLLAVLVDRSLITEDLADRVRGEIALGASRAEDDTDLSLNTGGRFFAGSAAESDGAAAMARAREAFREAYGLDPTFAPHADTVFERQDKLGEGGMGVVYRVFDKRLGRDAALKILHDNATERDVERFVREARVTAHLDHPTIPPIYEAGVSAQGQRYMLMRLIEGETLRSRIRAYHQTGRPKALLRELIEVLVKVGEAVAYAHSRGIVHRDLKPANIMVGRFGEVVLMDWGIARNLSAHEELPAADKAEGSGAAESLSAEAALTRAGAAIGTPGYMPPEQAGGEAVDARSDVYALGAILFKVLTDKLPVIGNSVVEVLAATVQGRILRPRDIDARCPRELDAIAAAALEEERERRLPSAERFVDELQAWLAGEPVSVYHYNPAERLVRFVVKHPILIMGSLGAALVAFIVVVALALLLSSAQQRRLAIEAQQRVETALEQLGQARELARRRGDPAELQRLIEAALEEGVRSAVVYQSAARIYAEAGMRPQAAQMLEDAALSFQPAYGVLFDLHLLALHDRAAPYDLKTDAQRRLRIQAERNREENLFTRLAAAVEAQSRGDDAAAMKLYKAIEAEAPGWAWTAHHRGVAHIRAGRLEAARADLKRFLELAPDDPETLRVRRWLETLGR